VGRVSLEQRTMKGARTSLLAGMLLASSITSLGGETIPNHRTPEPNVLARHLSEAPGARVSTEKRDTTLFAVFHTTEANNCQNNYNWLRGRRNRWTKVRRRWVKREYFVEPMAHLLVCEDSVYKIADLDRRVNHAGVSLFEGNWHINNKTIAVEFQGTFRRPLGDLQYELGKAVTEKIKTEYGLRDNQFISHAQAAVGEYNGQAIRLRKLDGTNFDWGRLGIQHRTDDPDVAAGRVTAEPNLELLHAMEARGELTPQGRVDSVFPVFGPVAGRSYGVVRGDDSPWSIATEGYNSRQTVYFLPNGRRLRGSEIDRCDKNSKCKGVTWDRIPRGTLVFPYVDESAVRSLTNEVRKNYALYQRGYRPSAVALRPSE
jgi:hypothetical protein